MVEGRSKAALSRFFIEQGPRWCLEREDCGHRRFPPLTGQPSNAIFPEPVTSWTASTPSDGSPRG